LAADEVLSISLILKALGTEAVNLIDLYEVPKILDEK